MLHRVKAEDRHVRNAAGASSFVFRAQRMARIFDDGEPVTLGQGENGIEIRRMPGVIDRQNGARVGRDALGQAIGIEIQSIGRNVGEHRARALVEHTIRRGCEGERRSDRLIARFQAGRERGSMQGGGDRTKSNCILRAHARGQRFFEFRDLGSGSQPIGAQDIHYGLDVVFRDRLTPVREHGFAHGSSTVDGERFLACGRCAHVIALTFPPRRLP